MAIRYFIHDRKVKNENRKSIHLSYCHGAKKCKDASIESSILSFLIFIIKVIIAAAIIFENNFSTKVKTILKISVEMGSKWNN